MDITRSDYRRAIFYAACFLVAVMIVSGIGILSSVGNHAVDSALASDTPNQAQTVKIAVVGMFNKVTVGQTQTAAQAEQPHEWRLFGWAPGDWIILAIFMAILTVFVVTACGAWLFFSPSGW